MVKVQELELGYLSFIAVSAIVLENHSALVFQLHILEVGMLIFLTAGQETTFISDCHTLLDLSIESTMEGQNYQDT